MRINGKGDLHIILKVHSNEIKNILSYPFKKCLPFWLEIMRKDFDKNLRQNVDVLYSLSRQIFIMKLRKNLFFFAFKTSVQVSFL